MQKVIHREYTDAILLHLHLKMLHHSCKKAILLPCLMDKTNAHHKKCKIKRKIMQTGLHLSDMNFHMYTWKNRACLYSRIQWPTNWECNDRRFGRYTQIEYRSTDMFRYKSFIDTRCKRGLCGRTDPFVTQFISLPVALRYLLRVVVCYHHAEHQPP